MGDWTIVIHGTGTHHNNKACDADQVARDMVEVLKARGHHVHGATFTHGGHDHIIRRVPGEPD
jgi:hypothetical protein